jgi:hypothetical protein
MERIVRLSGPSWVEAMRPRLASALRSLSDFRVAHSMLSVAQLPAHWEPAVSPWLQVQRQSRLLVF